MLWTDTISRISCRPTVLFTNDTIALDFFSMPFTLDREGKKEKTDPEKKCRKHRYFSRIKIEIVLDSVSKTQ